jgi:hypothetical protein
VKTINEIKRQTEKYDQAEQQKRGLHG